MLCKTTDALSFAQGGFKELEKFRWSQDRKPLNSTKSH